MLRTVIVGQVVTGPHDAFRFAFKSEQFLEESRVYAWPIVTDGQVGLLVAALVSSDVNVERFALCEPFFTYIVHKSLDRVLNEVGQCLNRIIDLTTGSFNKLRGILTAQSALLGRFLLNDELTFWQWRWTVGFDFAKLSDLVDSVT